MSSAAGYLVGAAVFPVRTMVRLLKDPHRLNRAASSVMLVGLLYVLTSLALAAAGASPLASMFLGVNPDNYYFWQMIFVLPVFGATWLLAATAVRVLGRKGAAGGGTRRAAAAAGLALAVALLIAWIPSLIEAIFMVLGMGQEEVVEILSPPGFWQGVYIGIHVLAGLSAFGLMTAAAAISQKIGWIRAVQAGFLAALGPVAVFIYLVR